jgi:glycyl-tRNA synthetase beta chain
MAEFLFEIGLEEVPARMIAGAQAELERRVVDMLKANSLLDASPHTAPIVVRSFSTPRRLAVYISGVLIQQPDINLVSTGPSEKVAYKDGQPTPALEAFARRAGISVKDTYITDTPKGRYIAANPIKVGRAAAEVIAEELPKELAGIYWAKNMYWNIPTGQDASSGGPARTVRSERFVRPVRWLLALLGSEVVPVEFGGKTAGSWTRGHRVLAGDKAIEISAPSEYEQALLGAHVIADVEARRHKIRKALDRVTREAGAGLRWREDPALVDTVTHLTEWPAVVMGGFEREYLALPEEVLVTVMRDHQKYFAVEDADGKLAAHFLAVLNTETDAAGEAVIRHGNERVLRARFNDARFFWEFDQRTPLVERVARLEKVTFQKDLGSYAAKSERVRELCMRLAGLAQGRGVALDFNALLDAAALAKADLTTELVKEFTELQGEVGGLYARAQGLRPAACDAIYDHYRPTSMEDRIPRTIEGQLLAIADKADTIAGMFGLGLKPTGSKDPFALRRAANGIVRILGEGSVDLGIGEVVRATIGRDEELVKEMEVFLAERLEFYLREAKGQAYDVVKAVLSPQRTSSLGTPVLAAGANDVRDAVARAEAVTAVRGSEDFAAVSAAFKRMKNILAQAEAKGDLPRGDEDGPSAAHPVETILTEQAGQIGRDVKELTEARNYIAALETIATLRPYVDEFFDQVMIMDPDQRIRHRRLRMLQRILRTFSGIADFSEIVTQG